MPILVEQPGILEKGAMANAVRRPKESIPPVSEQ